MARPEAFKHRGNTGNTGYGFDQAEDDSEDERENAAHQLA